MATSLGPASTPIAAELRRRVAEGELAPGDRLPSTRTLVREWGVAMATASAALAALRAEGLARTVPGVGLVVVGTERPAGPPAPAELAGPPAVRERPGSRPPTPALSSDRIVRAAVAVADAEGFSAVSMRRVATELGVATMSLYRHAPSKDDLVERMADLVLREFVPPAEPPVGWRPRLELVLRALWGIFSRHPWLVHAMSLTRPNPSPAALTHSEWMLTALEELGLDDATLMLAYVSVFNFVRGTATALDAETTAAAESGLDPEDWMARREQQYAPLFAASPTLARVVASTPEFEMDLDALFEFGLARLLDGFAVLAADAGRSRARRA